MGELAEDMISGIACAMCGVYLECPDCEENGIPMYCSLYCAKEQGANMNQVCKEKKDE